jgi:hypothetical protein
VTQSFRFDVGGGDRRETVAAHDVSQLSVIARTAASGIDDCGNLTEILRTNGSWRDYNQRLSIPASGVVETVNCATADAEDLPGADINFPSVHHPAQHTVNAINGFFVMVMAVRGYIQALPGWDKELKGKDRAI